MVTAGIAKGVMDRNPRAPSITSLGMNCRVRHSEFITIVNGVSNGVYTVAFEAPINAGNAVLFPWLSTIASRYESYRFNTLRFEYRPLCATTQPGLVALIVDPDESDPTPESLSEALNYGIRTRSNVWNSCTLSVPSGALNRVVASHFIDTTGSGGGTPSADQHTFNAGFLFVAFQGTTVGTGLGTLEVEYDVLLSTPEMHPLQGAFGSGTSLGGYRPLGSPTNSTDRDGEVRRTVKTIGNLALRILQGYDTNGNETHQIIAATAPFDGILELHSKGSTSSTPPQPIPQDFMRQAVYGWGNDSTADTFETLFSSNEVVTPNLTLSPPDTLYSYFKGRYHLKMKAGQFLRLFNWVGGGIAHLAIEYVFQPMMSEILGRVNDPQLPYPINNQYNSGVSLQDFLDAPRCMKVGRPVKGLPAFEPVSRQSDDLVDEATGQEPEDFVRIDSRAKAPPYVSGQSSSSRTSDTSSIRCQVRKA